MDEEIQQPKNRMFSLRTSIVAIFSFLFLATILLIVFYSYESNMHSTLKISQNLFEYSFDIIIKKTISYLDAAPVTAELGAKFIQKEIYKAEFDKDVFDPNLSRFENFMLNTVRRYPQIANYSVGLENGRFYLTERRENNLLNCVNTMSSNPKKKAYYKFVDNYNKIVKTVENPKDFSSYDPRVRPWYKSTKQSLKANWTDIYTFVSDVPQIGITASYPVFDKDGTFIGVSGSDVLLSNLSEFLRSIKIGSDSIVFIADDQGHVIAHPEGANKLFKNDGGSVRAAFLHEIEEKWMIPHIDKIQKEHLEQFFVKHNGISYILSVKDFPESFGARWKIALAVPEDNYIGAIKQSNRVSVMISLVVLFASILIIIKISNNISRPIVLLTKETDKIKNFDLENDISIDSSIQEIQMMCNAVSKLKTAMKAFKKYVPESLVRKLIKSGSEMDLKGRNRKITMFFSDICDFTTISENLPAEYLMLHLSEYLDELTKIIIECGGTVDKYIGDAIMAFWGAPVDDAEQEHNACRAAVLCQKKLVELNERWIKERKAPFHTRIAIHTGIAAVGNLGSDERINYTALGENVDVAEWLEGINKRYATKVLISEDTYKQVKDSFICRPLDIISFKGTERSLKIYELMDCLEKSYDPKLFSMSKNFEMAFNLYLDQQWDDAIDILEDITRNFPEDETAALFLKRCREYRNNPLLKYWKGINKTLRNGEGQYE